MGGKKTSDGKFVVNDLVRIIAQLSAVRVEPGNSHQYLIKDTSGNNPFPCALGPSTSTDHHIIPFLKRVTGYSKREILDAFRNGYWGEPSTNYTEG